MEIHPNNNNNNNNGRLLLVIGENSAHIQLLGDEKCWYFLRMTLSLKMLLIFLSCFDYEVEAPCFVSCVTTKW